MKLFYHNNNSESKALKGFMYLQNLHGGPMTPNCLWKLIKKFEDREPLDIFPGRGRKGISSKVIGGISFMVNENVTSKFTGSASKA